MIYVPVKGILNENCGVDSIIGFNGEVRGVYNLADVLPENRLPTTGFHQRDFPVRTIAVRTAFIDTIPGYHTGAYRLDKGKLSPRGPIAEFPDLTFDIYRKLSGTTNLRAKNIGDAIKNHEEVVGLLIKSLGHLSPEILETRKVNSAEL